jgi:hypothetical protein
MSSTCKGDVLKMSDQSKFLTTCNTSSNGTLVKKDNHIKTDHGILSFNSDPFQ